jgi:hypothetical protein
LDTPANNNIKFSIRPECEIDTLGEKKKKKNKNKESVNKMSKGDFNSTEESCALDTSANRLRKPMQGQTMISMHLQTKHS